ncbi:hypothetical protein BG000_005700 [Podila horticola]|nr:hypothetical protein BG000_005700 [Podila horticola]
MIDCHPHPSEPQPPLSFVSRGDADSTTFNYQPLSSPSSRKPGLYGRANIWGSNRTVRMILLTTALMGLQFTWSVEMAYGTPFLLQLGLSKSLMSLVWLAGPLSGLIMQPVVGVLSDRCSLKLGRRRPFLIVGVALVVLSFLCLGWCKEITVFILGSESTSLDGATILVAVASIYILDFAINCVQASCRTLIVDSLPSSQQEAAAAWASRLMGLGGIFGYFMGNVNIPRLIPAFGDTQVKGLCIIACLFLVLAVGTTCVAVTEQFLVRPPKASSSFVGEFLQGFKSIFRSIRYLPTRIQQLCNVQFFAWMGWFPFLFYSSTYIAEIYTREQSQKGVPIDAAPGESGAVQDAAVRAGSYCLLIYSIVSLGASLLLPILVAPATTTPTESDPFSRSSSNNSGNGMLGIKRKSKWSRARICGWIKLPVPGLTLPRMYTLSLILVSVSLMGTWLVQDLQGSTVLFSFCGIAWAVSMWAPFSILGEVISQRMQEEQHQARSREYHVSHSEERVSQDFVGEAVFSKVMDDDGVETEEIGMSEGRKYQPLTGRESLEHVVSIIDSSQQRPNLATVDSFMSLSGTPLSAATATAGQAVDGNPAHIDTESDTDHSTEEEGTGGSHRIQGEDRSSSGPDPSPHASSSSPSGSSSEATSAGALLGIHNIYIVLPQFLVSFLSSVVFAAIEPKASQEGGGVGSQDPEVGNPDTIGVMLRFGGVMAGIAALLSLRLWKQPRSVVAASSSHH